MKASAICPIQKNVFFFSGASAMHQHKKSRKLRRLSGYSGRFLTLVGAFFLCLHPLEVNAADPAVDLSGTLFETVGKETNIDPYLLYSIALCESAYHPDPKSGLVAPYPWVLRTKTPFYGANRAETAKELQLLLGRSQRSVDVGLMQLNVFWHGHRIDDPIDLLDPKVNIRIGAEILNELFQRYPNDALKAIGFYHSRIPEKASAYSQAVWRVYTQIRPYK